MRPPPLSRRVLLRAAVLGGASLAATSCSSAPRGRPAPATAGDATTVPDPSPTRILLVYFSRGGESYYYGGRRTQAVGNTQVLAEMIRDRLGCDVHRIEAADPYSADYDDTVARNVREQEADGRPALANPLPALDAYDTVLLGSPIWNVRAPMIMSTFVEGVDLSGKTVLPFVTYAVSGLGTVPRDYAASAPGATVRDGLAVRGEEVGAAATRVEGWLRGSGLLPR